MCTHFEQLVVIDTRDSQLFVMHWRIAHYSDEATMCVVVAITHDFAQENV
jgi:hypothetical protein